MQKQKSLLSLKVNKEAVSGITGDFSFEITEVTRHKNAELNQELFDKVFGEGVVTSEEEFKNKIREALAEAKFTPQSDFKFWVDAVTCWFRRPVNFRLPKTC